MSWDWTVDDRRSLVAGRIFPNETVKDVRRHFVNHVMGLDKSLGLSGAVPPLFLRALVALSASKSTRPQAADTVISSAWAPG